MSYSIMLWMIFLMHGTSQNLTVSSPAFEDKHSIPMKYTCEGDNINPEIRISGVPKDAKSLVLIVDDPDATGGKTFDHWVVFNMLPQNTTIKENSRSGVEGKNGAGKNAYTGPCPPTGEHRYFFKVYALDDMLDIGKDAGKKEVEEAMKGHILAQAELIGMYKKLKK